MPKRSSGKRPDLDRLIAKYGLDLSQIDQVMDYYKIDPKDVAGDFSSFLLGARSNTEARIRKDLDRVLLGMGRVSVFIGYEWFSFRLPGGSYTPDFSVLTIGGKWICFEIKGSYNQSNYRDARSKIRAAASLNPWFQFFELMPKPLKDGGGVNIEEIKPDPHFLQTFIQLLHPIEEEDDIVPQ